MIKHYLTEERFKAGITVSVPPLLCLVLCCELSGNVVHRVT